MEHNIDTDDIENLDGSDIETFSNIQNMIGADIDNETALTEEYAQDTIQKQTYKKE